MSSQQLQPGNSAKPQPALDSTGRIQAPEISNSTFGSRANEILEKRHQLVEDVRNALVESTNKSLRAVFTDPETKKIILNYVESDLEYQINKYMTYLTQDARDRVLKELCAQAASEGDILKEWQSTMTQAASDRIWSSPTKLLQEINKDYFQTLKNQGVSISKLQMVELMATFNPALLVAEQQIKVVLDIADLAENVGIKAATSQENVSAAIRRHYPTKNEFEGLLSQSMNATENFLNKLISVVSDNPFSQVVKAMIFENGKRNTSRSTRLMERVSIAALAKGIYGEAIHS